MFINRRHSCRHRSRVRHHESRITSRSAVSIVEFIIAVGIAGVILANVCLLWFYSSRSFAAQFNYADMDQTSQRALDTISQNIRQCKSLTNFTDTKLVFVDYDDKLLTLSFDNGFLYRQKGAEAAKKLLKDCKSGQFGIYQRTPISGVFDYYPTTDPTICKLVEVSWLCSRKLYPSGPTTAETMQSAKIVLRTK